MMRPITENELCEIREKVACPQFGDDHYGAWGALGIDQRRTIMRMAETIRYLRKSLEVEVGIGADYRKQSEGTWMKTGNKRRKCGNSRYAQPITVKTEYNP